MSESEIIVAGQSSKSNAQSYIDILFKHESRIKDIENSLDSLSASTAKTNHHLGDIRMKLELLAPITQAVEAIEEAVEKNEKEIEKQKTSHDLHRNSVETDMKHLVKQTESISEWIKLGIKILIGLTAIFFTAATALKIFAN